MSLSDKQKAFLKKLAVWFLWIAGWWLLLNLLWLAGNFVYESQVTLYGPADFVGRECVIYMPRSGEFFYTNPAGMIIRSVQLLLFVGGIVLFVSLITAWGVQKAKFFKKLKFIDKWLIAALIYAGFAIIFNGCGYWQSTAICSKFFHQVRDCQTIADYEKLCGKAVWQKTVDEKDSEFVNAIAKFEKCGFKTGRELHIFKYSKPEVYLLIWSENGKIVHRNWCHQSAADKEKVKGI